MLTSLVVTYGICALLTLSGIHKKEILCQFKTLSAPSEVQVLSSREEMNLYFHAFDFVFVSWYSASGEESLQAQPVFSFKEEGSNQMCNKVKSEKFSGAIRPCTHLFVYIMGLLQCGQEPHLLNENKFNGRKVCSHDWSC